MKRILEIFGKIAFACFTIFVAYIGVILLYYCIFPKKRAEKILEDEAKCNFYNYIPLKTQTRKADLFDLIACKHFNEYKQKFSQIEFDIYSLSSNIRSYEELMEITKDFNLNSYKDYKRTRDNYVRQKNHLENSYRKFIDSLKSEIHAVKDSTFDCIFIDHTFLWNKNKDYGYSVGVYSNEEKRLLTSTFIENIIERNYFDDFLDILSSDE